jgi:ABC-type nitrate/sulfonate/bicarbonate transport system permease component
MSGDEWHTITAATLTTLLWVMIGLVVAFVSAILMAVLSLSSKATAAVLEVVVSVTQYVPIIVWFPLLLLVTNDVAARAIFIGTLGGAFEAFVFLKGKLLGLERGITLVRRTTGQQPLIGVLRRVWFLLLPFAASYSTITFATVLPNVFIMIILADQLLNLPSFWAVGGIGYLFAWRFRLDLPELAVMLFVVVSLTTMSFLMFGLGRLLGSRVREA